VSPRLRREDAVKQHVISRERVGTKWEGEKIVIPVEPEVMLEPGVA
jgi:hypothetical protein